MSWEMARPGDPDVSPLRNRLLRALAQRIQWRNAINAAKDRAAQHDDSTANVSATHHNGEVPQWMNC